MNLHLNSYGTYLHVKDELFEIKWREDDVVKVRQQAAKKVSGIWLNKATRVSGAAIALALKHNIDVVLLENDGTPLGRFWHSKLGSTTRIRKLQLEASRDERAVRFVREWLVRKLDNQTALLTTLRRHRKPLHPLLDQRCAQIGELTHKIQEESAPRIDDCAERLRGYEGTAGRLYFGALSACLPERWRFNGRSFRPAADAFNAFLNYAYGILTSQTERALILAGLDPYVGFLHRDDYNLKSMVFDFIEPFRTYADEPVFRLFSGKQVNESHLDEYRNGVGLSKAGKQLLVEAWTKHFHEVRIRHRGRNQTRHRILQLEAHAFAAELLGRSPDAEPPEVEII